METHGRKVSYDIPDPNLPEVSQWLIANPNRVNLGRIGLKYKGTVLSATQIEEPKQILDVWKGTVTSTFQVGGEVVRVITQGDFDSDAVAFDIESKLVKSGALEVVLDFPFPPIHTTKYKYEVFVGSYDFPLNHTTEQVKDSLPGTAHIYHEMQETKYFVNLRWPATSPLELSKNDPADSTERTRHQYNLAPHRLARKLSSRISFTAHFSPSKRTADLPAAIRARNVIGWQKYWKEGGFVDLTKSLDPKADELQRRIILSQYHVRVNSAAKGQSPQESGLMNNGWYGMCSSMNPSSVAC